MPLEKLARRRGLLIQLGDRPVTVWIVVVGVDDDLAPRRFGGDTPVGPQGNTHHGQVARLGGLGRVGGSGAWAQLVHQLLERLGPWGVAEDHVVACRDCQPGHGASDPPAADQSKRSHAASNPLVSVGQGTRKPLSLTTILFADLRSTRVPQGAQLQRSLGSLAPGNDEPDQLTEVDVADVGMERVRAVPGR